MPPPRIFSWKYSAWTVQKQPSTAIHFQKFLQKILVVESFFCSNYRLAVIYTKMALPSMFSWKSSERFRSAWISEIVNNWGKFVLSTNGEILQMPNICLHEANLSLNHILVQLVPSKIFVYNVLMSMKKVVH